jgi:hypothetical protein
MTKKRESAQTKAPPKPQVRIRHTASMESLLQQCWALFPELQGKKSKTIVAGLWALVRELGGGQ